MKRTKCIQLKYDDMKRIRKKLYFSQNKKCAVLKQKIKWSETSLDHQHKLKKETPGPKGRGLIRGVLHLQANSFEGKVTNAYKRYGLHQMIQLPDLLRNLADYLENPPCPPIYIHPSERKKEPKIGKRQYNKIIKFYHKKYPRRRKSPFFPKSGKWTKELKILAQQMEKENV